MQNTVKQQFVVTYTNPQIPGATIAFIVDLEKAIMGGQGNPTLEVILTSQNAEWKSQGFTPYVDPAIRKARREKAKANKQTLKDHGKPSNPPKA